MGHRGADPARAGRAGVASPDTSACLDRDAIDARRRSREHARARTLSVEKIVALATKLAESVASVHAASVLHFEVYDSGIGVPPDRNSIGIPESRVMKSGDVSVSPSHTQLWR